MNLIEALQRWGELEPIREHVKWKANDLPQLEYAVRDAIEARGLYWSIERVSNDEPVKYFGRIQRIKGFRWVESSSSAAHALLLAYIAYLEGLAT